GFEAGVPFAVGGVVVSDGTNLTSTGSADVNIGGTPTIGESVGGTIVTTPDTNGRGTLTYGGLDFTYYIVTGEAIYFVETDTGLVDIGLAFGQGTTPNFTPASFDGEYVIDQQWPAGTTTSAFGPLALVGQFDADGVGTLTGVVDYNESGFV